MSDDRRLATPDVAARRVVVVAASFLALVAVVGAILTLVYRAQILDRRQPPRAAFPAPELQVAPRADLGTLRERENARLGGTGWIDREASLVRIPIAAAMALVVARGATGFDPIDGAPVTPGPARAPPDRPPGNAP